MEQVNDGSGCGPARITVRKQESLSERVARRRNEGERYDGSVRIWVNESQNLRCEKKIKKMCAIVGDVGGESEHYYCLSVLNWVRRDSMRKGGRHRKTVRSKNKGRVRTVVVVRRDGVPPTKAEEDGMGKEEEVEVVSTALVAGRNDGNPRTTVSTGNGDGEGNRQRTLHGVRNGNNRRGSTTGGVKKVVKRRRRRQIITVSDFELFKEGEVINGKKGRNKGRDISEEGGSGESEKDKFNRSIKECLTCTTNLGNRWEDAPFFRCSGGRRRNQKFICVSTMRTKRYLSNGRSIVTVLFSVVVEEQSRKLRNMIVKREKQLLESGTVLEDSVTKFCSCDVNWEANGIVNSSCWHITAMAGNTQFMSHVNSIIEFGFIPDHTMYYGDVIVVRGENATKTVTTLGTGGREEPLDTREHGQDGLIAIQLDCLTARDLLEKGSRISKKWSAWSVIDTNDSMVVTVVWRATSNRTRTTRMECIMCRTELARKCRHEVVCEAERKIERVTSGDEYSTADSDLALANPVMDVEASNAGTDVNNTGRDNGSCFGVAEPGRHSDRPQDTVPDDAERRRIDFFPKNYKRSFMMCRSEQVLAEMLTDLIETHAPGSGSLMFGDPEGVECEGIVKRRGTDGRCDGSRVKSCTDVPRKVTLFTLNHDDITIVVRDWVCETCGHYNVYRGTTHGIYPSEAGIAYTVELMYTWVHEMCISTKSFRSVYSTTRKMQDAVSYRRRFETGRVNKLSGSRMHNRRNENTAIRHFIKSIDMDGDISSGQLFHCPKCEVDMDENDCQQLGVDIEQYRGVKRMKSVVIDGKVVALLKDGRKCTDEHDVLHSVSGVSNRVIKNRVTQNAFRLFMKMVRRAIAWRRDGAALLRSDNDEQKMKDGSFVHNGMSFMRLGGLVRHTTTKSQSHRSKVVEYVGIVRWYLDPTICMCRGDARTASANHDGCSDVRERLEGTGGKELARSVLSSLFENVHQSTISSIIGMNGSVRNGAAVNGTDGNNEYTDESDVENTNVGQDNTGEGGQKRSKDDLGVDDSWVRLKYSNFSSIHDLLDTSLEVISFCFVEPITLGYFPFQTQNGVVTDGESDEVSDRMEIDGVADNVNELEQSLDSAGRVDGVIVDEVDVDAERRNGPDHDVSSGVGDNVVAANSSGSHVQSAEIETAGESVRNVENGGSAVMNDYVTEESDDREVRDVVKKLASESALLHRKVSEALHEAYSCKHGNRTITDWICKKCITRLGTYQHQLMLQNCVVGKFVKDFMACGRHHPVFSRLVASTISNLIERRTDLMDGYLQSISEKLPKSSIDYWKKYGRIAPDTLRSEGDDHAATQDEDSLYTFPGRHRCRQGIDFEKVDRQDCTKNYFKGQSTVPSFLTVQCACAHPKLVGFIVLRECESISAPLSSVITHFPVPPRTVWYDNACNTYDSAVIRIPWLLRWTMLIVDRFHFTGHICSNYFNGNRHRILDDYRSVAAEVINAVIDKCTNHINYLEGRNVVPFMKVLFGYLNACAYVRERIGRGDLEDEDLGQLFREIFVCPCALCENNRAGGTAAVPAGNAIQAVEGISVFSASNTEALLDDSE